MSTDLVQILEGNTFVVSDNTGDIEASLTDPTGLFSFDTRYLSKWILLVNGSRLNALTVDDTAYYETRFFLVPGTGTVYVDSKLSVIRVRTVADGFYESLSFLNHQDDPVDLEIRLEAASDFADLFEVKDALKKKGKYYNRIEDGCLILGYERDTYVRETQVVADEATTIDQHGVEFSIQIAPHGRWSTELAVLVDLGSGIEVNHPKAAQKSRRSGSAKARGLDKWIERAPA